MLLEEERAADQVQREPVEPVTRAVDEPKRDARAKRRDHRRVDRRRGIRTNGRIGGDGGRSGGGRFGGFGRFGGGGGVLRRPLAGKRTPRRDPSVGDSQEPRANAHVERRRETRVRVLRAHHLLLLRSVFVRGGVSLSSRAAAAAAVFGFDFRGFLRGRPSFATPRRRRRGRRRLFERRVAVVARSLSLSWIWSRGFVSSSLLGRFRLSNRLPMFFTRRRFFRRRLSVRSLRRDARLGPERARRHREHRDAARHRVVAIRTFGRTEVVFGVVVAGRRRAPSRDAYDDVRRREVGVGVGEARGSPRVPHALERGAQERRLRERRRAGAPRARVVVAAEVQGDRERGVGTREREGEETIARGARGVVVIARRVATRGSDGARARRGDGVSDRGGVVLARDGDGGEALARAQGGRRARGPRADEGREGEVRAQVRVGGGGVVDEAQEHEPAVRDREPSRADVDRAEGGQDVGRRLILGPERARDQDPGARGRHGDRTSGSRAGAE